MLLQFFRNVPVISPNLSKKSCNVKYSKSIIVSIPKFLMQEYEFCARFHPAELWKI